MNQYLGACQCELAGMRDPGLSCQGVDFLRIFLLSEGRLVQSFASGYISQCAEDDLNVRREGMDRSSGSSQEQAKATERVQVEAVSQDRIQIAFRIDELLRRLVEDRLRVPAPSCNGC